MIWEVDQVQYKLLYFGDAIPVADAVAGQPIGRLGRGDEIAAAVPAPIVSISLRAWPADFPDDIAFQRRVPYESRADSVMYLQLLAELARIRGWDVHTYDARRVEAEAAAVLGDRAHEVLHGPRATLGPPWSKDLRLALAASAGVASAACSAAGASSATGASPPCASPTPAGKSWTSAKATSPSVRR